MLIIKLTTEKTVSVIALKPTTLLAMFGAPQLEGVAREVEDTMVKIMNEAAGETL